MRWKNTFENWGSTYIFWGGEYLGEDGEEGLYLGGRFIFGQQVAAFG